MSEDPAAKRLLRVKALQEKARRDQVTLDRVVNEARDAGISWRQIATLLGTSRQAAQQRYGAQRMGKVNSDEDIIDTIVRALYDFDDTLHRSHVARNILSALRKKDYVVLPIERSTEGPETKPWTP